MQSVNLAGQVCLRVGRAAIQTTQTTEYARSGVKGRRQVHRTALAMGKSWASTEMGAESSARLGEVQKRPDDVRFTI